MAALVLSLAGNVSVELLTDRVTGVRPVWTYMMFMAAYAVVGAFGVEPSSAVLTRPGPAPRDDRRPSARDRRPAFRAPAGRGPGRWPRGEAPRRRR